MLGGIEFIIAYWAIIGLGARISGSHYNPAITLAYTLRRNVGNFSRWMCIAYIIAQFIGIFVGALLAFLFTADGGKLQIQSNKVF